MSPLELAIAGFFGGVVSDLLALAVALKEKRKLPKIWTRPRTYAGIALQGVLPAIVVVWILSDYVHSSVSAAAVGLSFPQVLQKLAQLSPRFDITEVAGTPGVAADRETDSVWLERIRRFFARE